MRTETLPSYFFLLYLLLNTPNGRLLRIRQKKTTAVNWRLGGLKEKKGQRRHRPSQWYYKITWNYFAQKKKHRITAIISQHCVNTSPCTLQSRLKIPKLEKPNLYKKVCWGWAEEERRLWSFKNSAQRKTIISLSGAGARDTDHEVEMRRQPAELLRQVSQHQGLHLL